MTNASRWILATALAGLPVAVGVAYSDELELEIVEATENPPEPDCGKPPDDGTRDEQDVIEELIGELQCTFDGQTWKWIRLCYTNPP